MWRIGRLARMAGVSERTLRHYDGTGLPRPAAVDHLTGYRWYGVAELSRLERAAAVADEGGEPLVLPARQVVRAVARNPEGVVRAGHGLFAWLGRHGLKVAGPALEEHLVDDDGGHAVVLDVPAGCDRRSRSAVLDGRVTRPAAVARAGGHQPTGHPHRRASAGLAECVAGIRLHDGGRAPDPGPPASTVTPISLDDRRSARCGWSAPARTTMDPRQ